jgi:hypothetical protein
MEVALLEDGMKLLFTEYGVNKMKLGINEKFFIRQINTITDPTLTVIELDETLDEFPFIDRDYWTDELLLTYCYEEIKKDDKVVEIKIYKKKEVSYNMSKDITITKYELVPNDIPTNIVVGFTVALNVEELPENTTFYVESSVSKDLTQQEAINQAWLQVKEEVKIKTEKLIKAAKEESFLLGQVFIPPSDEENQ